MNIRKCCIFLLLAAVLAAAAGCGSSGSSSKAEASYVHIDGEEAAELIAQGTHLLVDVRTEIPFRMGHIPGAINIPYDAVSEDPGEPVEGLPDKDQPLIIYCEYGGASKEVAEKLIAKGYTDVTEFDGLLVWEGELEEGDAAS